MCGRFTLRSSMPVLMAEFGLPESPVLKPRYNIAPTQAVAALRLASPDDVLISDEVGLAWLRWGLIPGWADDPRIGSRMINARGETVHEKPAFRKAFRERRCLVLADGYYEWRNDPAGKTPFWITRRDGRPMSFAGIWERWKKGQTPIESCAIITTDANALTAEVHDRMPVIIEPEDRSLWLNPDSPEERLRPLLKPCGEDELRLVRVSKHVNRPDHEDPSCLEPVAE